MLPYSKNWRFQIEDDGRVTGEAKEYSFTLTAMGSRMATEKEYLEAIVANLRSSPFLRRNVELLDVKGDVVLRYQSRPENLSKEYASLDPWWWHYRTAQGREGAWLDVHLSLLAPAEDIIQSDEKLKVMMGRGLRTLQ